MTTEHKTHYRKVFKSDHLGKADLEDFLELGSDLIFTIAQVRQELGAKVTGKKIDANTETNKSVEQELKNLYELNVNQSNWNTKVGTIIEIQTGIQVNP